ncbi:MAG: cysteine hydrolase [Holdemanella sp.]|nr:cysteine hydrolase [Holdemanella sp.]
MQDILLVIDMQNDFIDGSLGTKEAVDIVANVEKKIKTFQGLVLFTRDTHFDNYLDTQEGKKLPVKHCIKDTYGWQIRKELDILRTTEPIDKVTFGSIDLGNILLKMHKENNISSITLIGLCTDICVISNAMIVKAFLPEVNIIVDASCCAGVHVSSHENALNAMELCQIKVINRELIL